MVKKFTELENVLLGLDSRDLVPAFRELKDGFQEFLFMKEVDMVKVMVGMVKRLLMGQADKQG